MDVSLVRILAAMLAVILLAVIAYRRKSNPTT